MKVAEKPITIYKNVMLGLLVVSVCATFFASYFFIGPFIGSPTHLWLKNQMILAPIIKELIDVGPMHRRCNSESNLSNVCSLVGYIFRLPLLQRQYR